MKKYLIEFNGELQVVSSTRPSILNGLIGKVPENVSIDDEKYLNHRLIDHDLIPGAKITEIYVDQDIKAAAELQAQEEADIEKWIQLREERDKLLEACDYTQLPDAPLTAAEKAEYATYRQALRDFPDTVTDIDNYTWPTKP